MVRITEEMIRKRPEYKNCQISTLEELCLIQEYIEKIDFVQDRCSDLQVLQLQGNIISRIENVHKLKRLSYLNLAINNIEIIDNLEQCENLERLDLSLNFIGNLECFCSLRVNLRLRELYLSGNPCADFPGYRFYLIYILPQLRSIDGRHITLAERMKATEMRNTVEKDVREAQAKHVEFRSEQSARFVEIKKKKVPGEVFWIYRMEHCPEVRSEKARLIQYAMSKKKQKDDANLIKKLVLFSEDGRPLHVNQAKLNFTLTENPEMIELDCDLYKYLDSKFVSIDLNSTYVRINIQQYIFQYALPKEVNIDNSVALRSNETGRLLLRMPILTNVPDTTIAPTNPLLEDCEWKQTREYLGLDCEKESPFLNFPQFPDLD